MATAVGWGVGSPADTAVEPVGEARDLARFTFRVTTPPVLLAKDPDGSDTIGIRGFGTRERVPGAPDLPSHTVLIALPPGATPVLDVRPLASRWVTRPKYPSWY